MPHRSDPPRWLILLVATTVAALVVYYVIKIAPMTADVPAEHWPIGQPLSSTTND